MDRNQGYYARSLLKNIPPISSRKVARDGGGVNLERAGRIQMKIKAEQFVDAASSNQLIPQSESQLDSESDY